MPDSPDLLCTGPVRCGECLFCVSHKAFFLSGEVGCDDEECNLCYPTGVDEQAVEAEE